jgi:hypothetical protein
LEDPNDSLTEWLGEKSDYGSINLFGHYLVDQYGIDILVDSLKSKKIGSDSITEALVQNGYNLKFSQVFANWMVAVSFNNCQMGDEYCFRNANLKNFKIVSPVYLLSLTGDSSLSISDDSPAWSGNWYKLIGGKGDLTLDFSGDYGSSFNVYYVSCDYQGFCSVHFLDLDDEQKGRISISDFNSNYSSFVLMPFITSSVINFQTYHFNWKASVVSSIENNQELIKQLLAQINFLKNEIAKLQAQLGLSQESKNFSCGEFENDLYFGMANSSEVECLQKFLTSQGENIYPEGWATGNFYTATQNAVIKYQALKGIMQTGYFGPLTRAAANFDMGF